MPADALIRLNEVTNELLELARASRANKVRIDAFAIVHQRPAALGRTLAGHDVLGPGVQWAQPSAGCEHSPQLVSHASSCCLPCAAWR